MPHPLPAGLAIQWRDWKARAVSRRMAVLCWGVSASPVGSEKSFPFRLNLHPSDLFGVLSIRISHSAATALHPRIDTSHAMQLHAEHKRRPHCTERFYFLLSASRGLSRSISIFWPTGLKDVTLHWLQGPSGGGGGGGGWGKKKDGRAEAGCDII